MHKILCKLGIHKWITLDSDGEACYEECSICYKRQIFFFSLGQRLLRKQWQEKRDKFMRESRSNYD